MVIKVLGGGCKRCHALEKITRQAVADLEIDAAIEKVEDLQEIMKYSVMRTPALVINEEVVMSGNLPPLPEIKELILKFND